MFVQKYEKFFLIFMVGKIFSLKRGDAHFVRSLR